MNKKVILIICAVIAFFAGAILLDQFPIIGTLVALFELCVGGFLGYLWGKDKFEAMALNYEKQYTEFKADYVKLENQYRNLKKQKSQKKVETPVKA